MPYGPIQFANKHIIDQLNCFGFETHRLCRSADRCVWFCDINNDMNHETVENQSRNMVRSTLHTVSVSVWLVYMQSEKAHWHESCVMSVCCLFTAFAHKMASDDESS